MTAAHARLGELDRCSPIERSGRVRAIASGQIVATGPAARLGSLCEISLNGARVLGAITAVNEDHIVLCALDNDAIVERGAHVRLASNTGAPLVGEAFAGRAIDALGRPLDGGNAIAGEPLSNRAAVLAPMARREPHQVLETGIRAIDGLLTLGQGQRIGVFSASGVGKTTLVRQLVAQVKCDHCVICLVGERGHEVESLWRALASRSDKHRFSLVAATSDVSPVLRARAVEQALSLAEFWRARGQHVLLVLDSATRYAMALREIGLAAGDTPTLRAYTTNVFSALPRVVERCGAAKDAGAISAVFTVLSETDDVDDPITEVMKSLLDGHIVLSREIAEQGRFPAIDVSRSVSRHARALISAQHASAARQALVWLSVYTDARIMIESGLYKAGAKPEIDEAIARRPALLEFLTQSTTQRFTLGETEASLTRTAARHA